MIHNNQANKAPPHNQPRQNIHSKIAEGKKKTSLNYHQNLERTIKHNLLALRSDANIR